MVRVVTVCFVGVGFVLKERWGTVSGVDAASWAEGGDFCVVCVPPVELVCASCGAEDCPLSHCGLDSMWSNVSGCSVYLLDEPMVSSISVG